MISFTVGQLVAWIGAFCGMVTGVSAVVAIIINVMKKAKAPNELQDTRIDALEQRVNKIDAVLATDTVRFQDIEDGNRIMQQCMLALLRHGIDGNDIDSMKKAEQDLHNYLINRKGVQ